MIPNILTYADAVEYVRLFLGRNATSAAEDDMYRAINTAYRNLWQAHDWPALKKMGRIYVEAVNSDGTLTYDHTGGAYENLVTLSGVTPSASYRWWEIRVEHVVSQIADYKGGQLVTLDPVLNFGADLDAGTECTLERSIYPLPNDFKSLDQTLGADGVWRLGRYLPPEEWLMLRRNRTDSGDIEYHTVLPLQDAYGTMALGIWPPPDESQTVDFMYEAQPRPLRYPGTTSECRDGTATNTANSTKVTGSGTSWTDDMIGSILRLSSDSTNYPTGRDGRYPFSVERAIVNQVTSTWFVVDREIASAHSAVKYVVTDPIDIHASMFDAFLAGAISHIATLRNFDNKRELYALYQSALHDARCASYTGPKRQPAGLYHPLRGRLTEAEDVTDEE